MSYFGNGLVHFLRRQLLRLVHATEKCPVCGHQSFPFDAVDFNKSCEELRGLHLQASGISVLYYRCRCCGFCHVPEIAKWDMNEFEKRIYNDEYVLVDPDYLEVRPHTNAQYLQKLISGSALPTRHLDYGAGNGALSNELRNLGWESHSYDPFVDRDTELDQLGKYDLITAIEVFEHVPDPKKLMDDLSRLIEPNGIIIFSTLFSDKHMAWNKPFDWWYASPRNGHISLFSRYSLSLLAKEYHFRLGSFSDSRHCMFREPAPWANQLMAHLFLL